MSVATTFRVVLRVLDVNIEIKTQLQAAVIIGRVDPYSSFVPDINLEQADALDAGVSRRHAIILPEDNGLMIKDLDSANGTFINDEQLKPNVPYSIRSGDHLRLGYLELIVTYKQVELSGLLKAVNKPAPNVMNAPTGKLIDRSETPQTSQPTEASAMVIPAIDPGINPDSGQTAEEKTLMKPAKRPLENLSMEQRNALAILRKFVINRDISERMMATIIMKVIQTPRWQENRRLAVMEIACEHGYVDKADLLREQRRTNNTRFDAIE
ncbi:MAG TPA: FHA domain-containing protein [Phototrophicaceae bacterium]|nr:FHA domain-containing protein [Phototrophicaceae bacterium]